MMDLLPWVGFVVFVAALLALDLGVFHREAHEVKRTEALIWSGVWIGLSVLFNVGVFVAMGRQAGIEWSTGYLVEKTLAIDNVFVFLLIFSAFSVPAKYQHRVRYWTQKTARAAVDRLRQRGPPGRRLAEQAACAGDSNRVGVLPHPRASSEADGRARDSSGAGSNPGGNREGDLGRPDLRVDESVMLATSSVIVQEIVVGTLRAAGHDPWQGDKRCGTS